ncbi:hypothetical protein Hanom_Chr11g00996481 [Helianthus anomalus]
MLFQKCFVLFYVTYGRVVKQGSKGEGCRGFHNLFDWNSKPNKKLVSKSANLSVQPQQKASIDTNMQITQYHQV